MAEKKRLSPRAESTRNSLEYAGAGAALIGAGAGADAAVAWDRKRKGMDGPIKAARKKKFTRRHAGQLGVKLGGRSAVATGLPLAAYGAYTALKPDQKTPRIDVKRDVVKPAAKGVALRDLADQQALKTGVPVEAKKSLYDGVVRGLGKGKVISRPKKDYVEFLDARGVKRFMPEARVTPVKGKKAEGAKVNKPVAVQPELPFGKSLSPEKKAQAKARAKKAGRRYPNAYDNMISGGAKFGKADKFLREYGDRISPKAEQGYDRIKRSRRDARIEQAAALTSAGVTGAVTGFAARDAKKLGLRSGTGRLSAGLAAAGAGLTGLSAIQAGRASQRSRMADSRLGKIKAKAYERAAAGEYGRDRVKKSDLSKVRVTDKDRRKYTTKEEFNRNRAMALGSLTAGTAGAFGGSALIARSGAKDLDRATKENLKARRTMRDENAGSKRARTSGLREGPRLVKPNRKGVYDITSDANSKKRKESPTEGRKQWAKANRLEFRGRAKLAGSFLTPLAALGTAGAFNVVNAGKHENKVKRRKLADMKRQTRG